MIVYVITFMKLLKTLTFIIATLISIGSIGQIDKVTPISNAKAAIIIDSLENRLATANESDIADIYYNLSLYYYQIDAEKSSVNALNFLQVADSLTLATEKIYSL